MEILPKGAKGVSLQLGHGMMMCVWGRGISLEQGRIVRAEMCCPWS